MNSRGGSGHAFKLGPKIGEYLADHIAGTADPAEKALLALSAHKAFPPAARRG